MMQLQPSHMKFTKSNTNCLYSDASPGLFPWPQMSDIIGWFPLVSFYPAPNWSFNLQQSAGYFLDEKWLNQQYSERITKPLASLKCRNPSRDFGSQVTVIVAPPWWGEGCQGRTESCAGASRHSFPFKKRRTQPRTVFMDEKRGSEGPSLTGRQSTLSPGCKGH